MRTKTNHRRRIIHELRDHSLGPVSYLELGKPDGPCIVFLHGFGADMLTWQYCLAPLARDHRLIALDFPGHGRTQSTLREPCIDAMVSWLCETFALLDIEVAFLVGHSMGGKISAAFARKYPYHVNGLVLIAPEGVGGDFNSKLLHRFLQSGTEEDARDLAGLLVSKHTSGLIDSISRSLMHNIKDLRRWQALKKLLDIGVSSHRLPSAGLDELPCPVHVIWGRRDRLITRPHSKPLGQNVLLDVIPGVGHLPHIEAASVVTSAISKLSAKNNTLFFNKELRS